MDVLLPPSNESLCSRLGGQRCGAKADGEYCIARNTIPVESYIRSQLDKVCQILQQWTDTCLKPTVHNPQQTDTQERKTHAIAIQGKTKTAIATYRQTVPLLTALQQKPRGRNAAISFQTQIEPVYRQLVTLLLQGIDTLPIGQQQQRLTQACKIIESFQIAELEHFFCETRGTYSVRPIEQIDPQAAVIYSMVLDSCLEVIVSFPNGRLHHHRVPLPPQQRQATFQTLRQALNAAFPADRVLRPAQKIYDWLLRPAESALIQHGIQRLIFVVDSHLRNVPLAVLHNGHQFLIERYSIAVTPGLQLFDSPGLRTQGRQVLAGGLSAARQGFRALPSVDVELHQIQTQTPTQVLVNQDFTKAKLAQHVLEKPSSIMHLATHGQFSSRADETFILTWNNRLHIHDLEKLLQQREQQTPIEMLILSACQTAKGDEKATLGMAGVAVRSGARSTVASLWSVNDRSTAILMAEFYQQLNQGQSRAEALRQAQLSLLNSGYSHPFYWAPFVLIGTWL
ncbi:MAG: CHAT domain-containing protein [Cyanobacteria bacterium P01_D01_bin.156]